MKLFCKPYWNCCLRCFCRRCFSILLMLAFFSFCGMNTDLTALLAPLSYPAAKTPAISSVTFAKGMKNEPQFEVSYSVENSEANFAGYNLYVSNVPFSLESLLGGAEENRYLEHGYSPSFSHSNTPLNTEVTQRVAHRRAPPSPEPFYECYQYYFRLTAYLRGGFESEGSSEKNACAAEDPSSCPTQTPCNS